MLEAGSYGSLKDNRHSYFLIFQYIKDNMIKLIISVFNVENAKILFYGILFTIAKALCSAKK